jgi:DNA-binding CsgD family transcriptional regulator
MEKLATLFGGMFENIPNERNLFDHKPYSEIYQDFYKEILRIIHYIAQKKLNIYQKKILILFLEGKTPYEISSIIKVNHSTMYQNYNIIIKKISSELVNDDDFLAFIYKLPQYLRKNMFDWIEEIKDRYNIKKYYSCPVCEMHFKDKYKVKKHLQQGDNNHKEYYKKQLNFIKKMLKKHGFSVKWFYEHDDYLLFSLSWIWSFWEKNYKNKKSFRNLIRKIKIVFTKGVKNGNSKRHNKIISKIFKGRPFRRQKKVAPKKV